MPTITPLKKGDWITLDGSQGIIYTGKLDLVKPQVKNNIIFNKLLKELQNIKLLVLGLMQIEKKILLMQSI